MIAAVFNEHLTKVMKGAGVNAKYYTVKCPVCGKDTDMLVTGHESLEERLAIQLEELREYHER